MVTIRRETPQSAPERKRIGRWPSPRNVVMFCAGEAAGAHAPWLTRISRSAFSPNLLDVVRNIQCFFAEKFSCGRKSASRAVAAVRTLWRAGLRNSMAQSSGAIQWRSPLAQSTGKKPADHLAAGNKNVRRRSGPRTVRHGFSPGSANPDRPALLKKTMARLLGVQCPRIFSRASRAFSSAV